LFVALFMPIRDFYLPESIEQKSLSASDVQACLTSGMDKRDAELIRKHL